MLWSLQASVPASPAERPEAQKAKGVAQRYFYCSKKNSVWLKTQKISILHHQVQSASSALAIT
jgi:hypothetical protein